MMTVLTLARYSHKHGLNLEKLLKTLGLGPTNELPEVTFDFEGMLNSKILQKIVEQGEIARALYTKIVENTNPRTVSTLFGDRNVEFFYYTQNRWLRMKAGT